MSHLLGDGDDTFPGYLVTPMGVESPDDRLFPDWYALDLVVSQRGYETAWWPTRSWYLGSYGRVLGAAGAGAGGSAAGSAGGARGRVLGGAPVFYSHLTVYNNDLYAAYTKVSLAGIVTVCKLFKTVDGSIWNEEKDLLADGGSCVANIQVLGTDLFVACVANPNMIGSVAGLWRKRAGVWTKVSTAAITGPMGII